MKTSDYKGSIQKQLVKSIFIVLFSIFIIGYIVFVSWYIYDQDEDNVKLSKSVSNVISQDMAKLVLLNDLNTASDITTKLKSFKPIQRLVLFNKDKKAIYQYSKNNKTFQIIPLKKIENRRLGDVYRIYDIVNYQGIKLGYVEFDLKSESIFEIVEDDLFVIIAFLLLLLFLSYFLAKIYSQQFSKPILDLVYFLENIEFEKLDSLKKRLKIIYNNEFGKLYEEVNILLDKLLEFVRQQKISSVAFEIKSGMIITNDNFKVLKVNKSYTELTKYKENEVIGKKPPILNDKRLEKIIKDSLKNYSFWHGEIQHTKKDGEILFANLTIQPVFTDKKITHYVFSFIDITQQKKIEKKLQYLKEYDSLTGFLNKDYFLEYLHKEVINPHYQALFYIKIDNLKFINSIYGYNYGDIILKQISERLKSEFEEINKIGKIGVNDFMLYFNHLGNDKNIAILKIKTIAEMIEGVFLKPFEIENKKIKVEIIIGINLFKAREDEVEILKETNIALQTARESNQKIAFFDKNIEIQTKEKFNIYEDMLIALKENQFELFYQLQYCENGEIYGGEALIRWNHPIQGLIPPVKFIPIAEKTDLIVDIGNWVLNESCRQIKIFSENLKTKDWVIAVNVSAKQFKKDDFIFQVKNAMNRYNINSKNLKIELLETLFVDDVELVIEKMNLLKELGVKISLDDFGTGFSSLQYLKNFPLDQIKIDQSFVMNMFNNEKDIKIIKSIIYLGELLGIDVIAEGVEKKEHYEKLKELGCHYYQGYYFAKPRSIQDINENVIKKLV